LVGNKVQEEELILGNELIVPQDEFLKNYFFVIFFQHLKQRVSWFLLKKKIRFSIL